MEAAAWAHSQGVEKYGAYNWRENSVCSSTYTSAAMRHFNQWRDGEDIDSESGRHHLGHVIANLNILLDAAAHGTLEDDRNTKTLETMSTAISTRPFGLPPELPTPPQPPAGYRGVYRGERWGNNREPAIYDCCLNGVWLPLPARRIPDAAPGCFYIEYIPLRKSPEGVAEVPSGWEYFGCGPVEGWADGRDETMVNPDILRHGLGWVEATGNSNLSHYALRIGSEIHHNAFDPSHPIANSTGAMPMGPPKPEPVKAREWWLTLAIEGNTSFRAGDIIGWHDRKIDSPENEEGSFWKVVHVREVTANESALLEEVVGHLRAMLLTAESNSDRLEAWAWLDSNFPAPAPEPAPEPAFDMDKLWASVPAWHPYLTHDENGDCHTHSEKPQFIISRGTEAGYWEGVGDKLRIPLDIAPARPVNWMGSLIQRPTPTKQP